MPAHPNSQRKERPSENAREKKSVQAVGRNPGKVVQWPHQMATRGLDVAGQKTRAQPALGRQGRQGGRLNCPAIRNVEILASLAIKELNLWRRLDNGEKIPRGDIEEAMEKVDKAREVVEGEKPA